MSQMIWCRPKAVIEKFIPNEYIAACGDSGTVYNFECNAGIKYRGDRNYHYNVPVIIWTDHGTDVHCTTNLDMSQWSTAKS